MPGWPDAPTPYPEDSDELEGEDNGWDDEHNDVVYLKYMFEGAATLVDLSASLRELADHFDRQALDGWRLNGPVDNGYAHLVKDGA